MDSKQFDLIFYHSPCSDGTGGAWILWRNNKNAKLIPSKYGNKIPSDEELKDKSIVIVDFSFDSQTLLHISELSKSTLLLDHHASAERELNNITHPKLTIIFDMKRSGVQLAWDYIYPDKKDSRHWFVEMIADRDLWTWKLPWSKAVGNSTFNLGYHESVEKMEELYNSNKDYSEFESLGNFLIENDLNKINKILEHVVICHFHTPEKTYLVGVTTSPPELRSEVGSKMCNKFKIDFAVMYQYVYPQDEWWISTRASKDSIDLSVILKTVMPNSGGHPKASGGTIYGPNSNPPDKFKEFKGQTMFSYLTPLTKEELNKIEK